MVVSLLWFTRYNNAEMAELFSSISLCIYKNRQCRLELDWLLPLLVYYLACPSLLDFE